MPVAIFFDLFGTLLSPQSIAQELEKLYGEERAQSMASLARRYQLEYTWRANSMGNQLLHSTNALWDLQDSHATAMLNKLYRCLPAV